MHPPLAVDRHAICKEAIEALEQCHSENAFNKFLGKCNEAKNKVDQCLKEEYLVNQAVNIEKAKKRRERIKEIWKDMEEPPQFTDKNSKANA